VNSNATLDVGCVSGDTQRVVSVPRASHTVVAPQSAGNAITVSTLNSLAATNYVGIASIPAPSRLIRAIRLHQIHDVGGALNFGLAACRFRRARLSPSYISNNTANGSVDLVVTSGPTSIKWVGYGGGSPTQLGHQHDQLGLLGGSPRLTRKGSFGKI